MKASYFEYLTCCVLRLKTDLYNELFYELFSHVKGSNIKIHVPGDNFVVRTLSLLLKV